MKIQKGSCSLPLLVAILAHLLFALVGRDLMTFSLLTAWHRSISLVQYSVLFFTFLGNAATRRPVHGANQLLHVPDNFSAVQWLYSYLRGSRRFCRGKGKHLDKSVGRSRPPFRTFRPLFHIGRTLWRNGQDAIGSLGAPDAPFPMPLGSGSLSSGAFLFYSPSERPFEYCLEGLFFRNPHSLYQGSSEQKKGERPKGPFPLIKELFAFAHSKTPSVIPSPEPSF